MSNKKKPQEKPTQKKHEIGVSYTDRDGRRRYVYRSDFPTKSEIVVVVQIRSSSVGQKRIVLGSLNRSRQEWRLFFFFICSLVFEPCGAFLFGSNLICYIIKV